MAQHPPQISPDGAYWWDGQAWRPMPYPSAPVAAPTNTQPADRPSWLPEGVEIPGSPAQPSSGPAPVGVGTADSAPPAIGAAPPAYAIAPPPWMPQTAGGSANRTLIAVAAVTVLALMAGSVGIWAWRQAASSPEPSASVSTAASPADSPTSSPSASPTAALPLTAQLAGDYCPVAHRGDSACWQGSVINTGPPIGKLAMIFIVGSPYSNWFATHGNAALSGFYTTPGCVIDAPNARIVCGSVGSNQEADVYLGGDVTTRGTFNYAVKFADIASGSPVYIDQHPDGTHDIVGWTEVIS